MKQPYAAAFLSGGGETGQLMRTHDWSRSPLGDPSGWPQSLRTVVSLILNSKFPMFVAWGKELIFLYNDSYVEVLGNKHPAAFGRRFYDIWSEIWEDISPIIDRAMAGEASFHQNLPLLMHRKGFDEQTWFTFSYSPVLDETGAVAGMYCACTETTQQVLLERHQKEENERLRRLFQQAPGIMAVLREPRHVFELVNDAYLQLVGRRELIGREVRDALPEVVGQGFVELLDKVYATGEPFVGRGIPVKLQRQEGDVLEERFVDFVYQPIRNYTGEVTGIFVEGHDITEAVRASTALRESEQRLRQLANTIPQLAWMAHSNGHVHWYNDRWYEYTGTTNEEMAGWGWQKVYDPQQLPEILEAWKHSVATGTPFEATFPMRSASGEFRTFYTRAAPLRDAQGEIVQWFGTNTDVTQIEKAQEELRAANRRKDEFLAMLAHELRNPLAPISTAAQLLKLSDLDPERIRRTSAIITRQVQHMTELVDDLLDVSRVTRGLISLQKERIGLRTILSDAVEQVHSLIETKRQQLSLEIAGEMPSVMADRTRLIQVFTNIINNAAKYTPEHGRIAVRVKQDADRVLVAVEDNGIGISPELLPHVFDLFTQAERSPDRAQGGLGLGLALVKSLVELHGGTVSVTSAGTGRGSCFIVSLPVADGGDAGGEKLRSESAEARTASGLTLLVVDDNVDAAETLALLLETQGHRVLVEHSAQRGLERLHEAAPDLMFLDIGLPDMDGYDMARRIRSLRLPRQPVLVAVTGYGQPQDREQALAAGFDHHLVKPVQFSAIMGLMAQHASPADEECR
ncbi:PAS domain S-box-containing protein [Noviherbaspirillum humi]|uniref:histidine kinase n=1 Tax=Noviherbaspirillum humi TaxID=1688639 RepID=A0A239HZY5_9BURK|nr:PAS domain-containing protein [Noviherbaspirillum humi]SNS86940.1 PAS domain S-box-containing protein [Noviherbaspirillum humi]